MLHKTNKNNFGEDNYFAKVMNKVRLNFCEGLDKIVFDVFDMLYAYRHTQRSRVNTRRENSRALWPTPRTSMLKAPG